MIKNKFCNNCGEIGHYSKNCSFPKTSFGVIALSYHPVIINEFKNLKNNLQFNYVDIDNYNYLHISKFNKISDFYNNIKILMICRNHSLNYIEFMRGKYNTHESAMKMLSLMAKYEVDRIINNDFDFLWDALWLETSKSHIKEYKKSKIKFNNFKTLDNINIIKNMEFVYEEPEWCFPKGRKNIFEKSIDCAIREFKEETNHNINFDNICKNIIPIQEVYKGTDNNSYRNIYYLSFEVENEEDNFKKNNEVSKVKWVSYFEALKLLRPYYTSKKELINKIFMFLTNISIDNINKDIENNFILG